MRRSSSNRNWQRRKVRRGEEDAHDLLNRDPETVVLVDPRPVGAAGHIAPPIFLVKIPANGLAESGLEPDAASIAEFAGEFCGVDRIAVIMARPVDHVGDKRAASIRRSCGTGRKAQREGWIGGESMVKRVADQADDAAVVLFVAAADII